MESNYLGELSEVIGVQKELFQRTRVPHQVLGDVGQGTVSLVHVLNLKLEREKVKWGANQPTNFTKVSSAFLCSH